MNNCFSYFFRNILQFVYKKNLLCISIDFRTTLDEGKKQNFFNIITSLKKTITSYRIIVIF